MKIRAILTLLALVVTLGAHADENSKIVLDKIKQKISSYKSYQGTFSVSVEQQMNNTQGEFLVNGQRYYVDVYDYSRIMCDGKTKYTYSKQNNEVTIENVNPNDRNIIANPTLAFSIYDSDFTHRSLENRKFNGRTVSVVELKPKASSGMGAGVTILMYVDQATNLPVYFKCTMPGMTANMVISSFEHDVVFNDAMFSFDKVKYKGVEVIDFR